MLGFDNEADFSEIREELERLRDNDVVRLVDLMAVRHREHGVIETIQLSDLPADEALAFGAGIGALIGMGAGGDAGMEAGAVWGMRQMADGHLFDEDTSWAIAEQIPEGTSSVIALVEHRWRIPVRDAVRRAGGYCARRGLAARGAPRRARHPHRRRPRARGVDRRLTPAGVLTGPAARPCPGS